jgi:phosphoribosyl-ATP pyrophosphohydrolase/phosphoribosyl-AMP cyclohydrolase/histidinol dehydrogenase
MTRLPLDDMESNSITFQWPHLSPDQIQSADVQPFDETTFDEAIAIVRRVRAEGQTALRELAEQFGDLEPDLPLMISEEELNASLEVLPVADRQLLERIAMRIERFARAQRATITDSKVDVEGGAAGHRWQPLATAGCYAPGGRYPLPSSVLMTAVTARVAGVLEIWVASPRPSLQTKAAAAIAGARGLLAVGGAQAIAALAYGIPTVIPRCDVVVGPGNAWVTAAKAAISNSTRIDMLAGPSEIVIVATQDANPQWVAADLLAQAEHDPASRPILVTDSSDLARDVERELQRQLAELPTAGIAARGLANGGMVTVESIEQAISICQKISPEHLSLQGSRAESLEDCFDCCGALFIGSGTAEAIGDYGAGPNHVLPTGGTARMQHGLWVGSFMRFHTWLKLDAVDTAQALVDDAVGLARMEGLEGHARSAQFRRPG